MLSILRDFRGERAVNSRGDLMNLGRKQFFSPSLLLSCRASVAMACALNIIINALNRVESIRI